MLLRTMLRGITHWGLMSMRCTRLAMTGVLVAMVPEATRMVIVSSPSTASRWYEGMFTSTYLRWAWGRSASRHRHRSMFTSSRTRSGAGAGPQSSRARSRW